MTDAMNALRTLQRRLYAYNYAMNVIGYDDATVAPAKSSEGRGEALEVLSAAVHGLIAESDLPALLDQARSGPLTEQEAAEVQELQRQYDQISKIPAQEYAAFAKLTSTAQSVWTRAKRTNDFALFAPYLEQIVDTRRRWAAYFDADKAPYDVWLDQFERGASMARLDEFFSALRGRIVPLLQKIRQSPCQPRTDFLRQDWPMEQQRQLARLVMELMGVDSTHCVLGESEHPFTTEFYKGDVRITTHYFPEDMVSSLYSVIHESGHALYELHIADRLKYTCLAGGSTMGVHESQSRLFENYIGRSQGFIHCLWPHLTRLFPQQLAGVTEREFYCAVNQAQPGLIRTEADELTYCLHVMVRYELEKQLMDGSLAVQDLPAAWNAKMKDYLGVDVPDDTHGCLQDVHWAGGDLGYFPSYALGSAYGAQMIQNMRSTLDLDALTAAGDLAPISAWLEEHIWQYGREKEPAWLVQNACGGAFDPDVFARYLEEKYTDIYALG